jgi:hypothetical protein
MPTDATSGLSGGARRSRSGAFAVSLRPSLVRRLAPNPSRPARTPHDPLAVFVIEFDYGGFAVGGPAKHPWAVRSAGRNVDVLVQDSGWKLWNHSKGANGRRCPAPGSPHIHPNYSIAVFVVEFDRAELPVRDRLITRPFLGILCDISRSSFRAECRHLLTPPRVFRVTAVDHGRRPIQALLQSCPEGCRRPPPTRTRILPDDSFAVLVEEFDLGSLAIRVDPENPSVSRIPVWRPDRLGPFGRWGMATGSCVDIRPGCFGFRRLAPLGQHIVCDDQFVALLDQLDLGGFAVGLDVEDAGLPWMPACHVGTSVSCGPSQHAY